ncbi:MAG: DNA repair protein RecN [Acidimicrobiia bacterium]
MLDEIHASNIGLITNASVSPAAGLTVITGETGTGKTLMLGALRLVRGDNASKDVVGPHDDTVDVVARFTTGGGGEHVVRRTVSKGRSRAYIDGAPVTAGELSDRFGLLITIVSQHDQHALTSSDRVRSIVDSAFSRREKTAYDGYTSAYEALVAIEAEMLDLGPDQRALEREREMLLFQTSEIDEAGFAVGEEEALRARLDRLRNTEELSGDVSIAIESLGDAGARGALSQSLAAVERSARIDPELAGTVDALTGATSVLDDIAADLSRYAADLDANPAELAESENRLAALMALKRKYGESVSDIEAFAKSASERAEEIMALVDSAADVQERHQTADTHLTSMSAKLRQIRTKHADDISRKAVQHLQDLGFSDPLIAIKVSPKEPTATGADHLKVMFTSASSLPMGPVSAVASGGELSRLVLAITLAAGGADSEVVAFDEIDTGVGGSVALALGEKLKRLATSRQVICVTHLPQVAAFGDRHYRVTREGPNTSVDEVTGAERIEEISRMLAGLATSDKGKDHAEELLAVAETVDLKRG